MNEPSKDHGDEKLSDLQRLIDDLAWARRVVAVTVAARADPLFPPSVGSSFEMGVCTVCGVRGWVGVWRTPAGLCRMCAAAAKEGGRIRRWLRTAKPLPLP